MTREPLLPPAWREGFRRHEGTLAYGWLCLVAGFLLLLAVPPTRAWVLGGVQRLVLAREDRWSTELARGEALVRARQYEAAVAVLAPLNRAFPARDVRHGRDKERERLLLSLGAAYLHLGRKRRALETFQALAAFDPLNYRNHYALAIASDKLLSGWALAVEARDAYAAVLAIHPSHLPSVRGVVAYSTAKADWGDVRAAWATYLDAFLAQPLTLRLGADSVTVTAIATGQPQEVEFLLPAGTVPADSLRLDARTMGFAVDRLELVGALRSGAAAARHSVVLRDLPRSPTVRTLALAVPAGTGPVERVRATVRLLKPADKGLWNSVASAYRNLLDWDGLAATQARADLRPSPAAADSVLDAEEWAHEGQRLRPDEAELLQ